MTNNTTQGTLNSMNTNGCTYKQCACIRSTLVLDRGWGGDVGGGGGGGGATVRVLDLWYVIRHAQ